MVGYVYIIQSEKNSQYYIGSTNNVATRLAHHNAGRVVATRSKGPWIVKYQQAYSTITEARKIEYRLKKFKNRSILDRIITDRIIKVGV